MAQNMASGCENGLITLKKGGVNDINNPVIIYDPLMTAVSSRYFIFKPVTRLQPHKSTVRTLRQPHQTVSLHMRPPGTCLSRSLVDCSAREKQGLRSPRLYTNDYTIHIRLAPFPHH